MDVVKNCWLDSISYNLKASLRSGVIVLFAKVATLSYGAFVSISFLSIDRSLPTLLIADNVDEDDADAFAGTSCFASLNIS